VSKNSILKDLKHLPDYLPPPPKPVCAIVNGGPFGPDWRFTFGRYGRTEELLEDVIKDDPEYINWAVENVQGFSLTPCAQQLLSDSWEEINESLRAEEDMLNEEDPLDDASDER
jgi:hypothetical protein